MPMPSKPTDDPKANGALQYAKAWGGKSTPRKPTVIHALVSAYFITTQMLTRCSENPVPPALLGVFIFAQHAKPFQTLPMLFPPILLFSSYLNLSGYKTDSAGLTSAWSAAYLILARRRRQAFGSKFGVRGVVRGATLGLCVVNVLGGGLAYAFGKRNIEDEK